MQGSTRETDVKNRLFDSVDEAKGDLRDDLREDH